ncbi:MAG: tyrosine--tRNA ligase [Myxococcota bacterium]|nr:tyrosine--tRNA ligase [Myxococcota bacterium]
MNPELQAEVDRQIAVMREGCVDFYGEEELRLCLAERLAQNRPLRIKLGMDPSSPDLHIGHTVVLQKLKRFLELGHVPIFLIGDFTARIGDPSGKKKVRPPLSEEQVRENAETYVAQVARVLDIERVEIRFNNEWMSEFRPADFIRLCSTVTVARLLERDDFAKRYGAGIPIFTHEFLYPFVQAYDSVALEADVELGGSDQTFNLLMGREVQRAYGQKAQAVMTHPLLVGTDGIEKMSKSLGNSVGITDSPEEMYGKVMSVPDDRMFDYFDILSGGEWEADRDDFRRGRDGQGDPMALKHRLATRVVTRLCGADSADQARGHFRRVVQEKGVPEDLPEVELSLGGAGQLGVLEVLRSAELTGSNSEGRRLIEQGAVSVDGVRWEDPRGGLAAGRYLLKVGKRRFVRLLLGP